MSDIVNCISARDRFPSCVWDFCCCIMDHELEEGLDDRVEMSCFVVADGTLGSEFVVHDIAIVIGIAARRSIHQKGFGCRMTRILMLADRGVTRGSFVVGEVAGMDVANRKN